MKGKVRLNAYGEIESGQDEQIGEGYHLGEATIPSELYSQLRADTRNHVHHPISWN